MTSVEIVKLLCKERKVTICKLEKSLGFANGYIGQLKKGVIPSDRLAKIAAFFGVKVTDLIPVDYNCPYIQQENSEQVRMAQHLTYEQAQLLLAFDCADELSKLMVKRILKMDTD